MTDSTNTPAAVNLVDIFAEHATDTKSEKEGTLTHLPGCGPTLWRVARAGNFKYKQLIHSLFKKNRSMLESKSEEAEKKSDEILAEVYARTILLGWEGTINVKGKQQSYSFELAKQLLLLNDFREKVAAAASDFSTFKMEKDEEDQKN